MKMPLKTAGVHPEVGENRAEGAVEFDRERFLGRGERFLHRSGRLHVRTIDAGLLRQIVEPRGAWILGVIAMTKARHAIARFLHRRERVGGGFIHGNGLARRAIGDLFQFPRAIFNRPAVMSIGRHDAGRDRSA